ARAPIVIPLVIGGGVAIAKRGVVNVVFLFHAGAGSGISLAFSVVTDTAVFAFRVGIDIEFIIVIGVGLREWIHTIVATDTVVEVYAAVTAGATAYILAHAIGRQRRIVHLLEVTAQMVH